MPSQTRVDSASAVDNMKDDQRDKTRHVGTASGSGKLGTFTGVFVPTSLNVLSILMFLRFGMIMGQSGVLGMMCKSTDFLRQRIF
jgi:solute carrier family 12 (potassium/chloride transporters), member 9